MKTWLRWVLIVTQVGGGFTGLVITLDYLGGLLDPRIILLMISIGFMALYAFVTIAGLLYALDERRTTPLRAALWLQVPLISSPIISWAFSAGFCFNMALIGIELGVDYLLGSFWRFDLFTELPWGIGINLFALLMILLLRRIHEPQVATLPPIPAELDATNQSSSLKKPLEQEGIHLQSLVEACKSVVVNPAQYNSLGEARDEEVSLLIQSASRGKETGSLVKEVAINGEQCTNDEIVSHKSFHDQNDWRCL